MTREEAIYILRVMRAYNLNFNDLRIKDKNEALDMAIEALSAIEDIKAEIEEYRDNFILAGRLDLAAAVETCLMFIDKHISGKESK